MIRAWCKKVSIEALIVTGIVIDGSWSQTPPMPWIAVAKDAKGFIQIPSAGPFVPWGFNYDHDHRGRLLEDYWLGEWSKVESDFVEMKSLGANVVRIHLQLGKFMEGPRRANVSSLRQLSRLIKLAERHRIYLNLTGLGCYHKLDVSAWYDDLNEQWRWQVQSQFWEAVAAQCASSPAIFCYDLMNEPVIPGRRRQDGDWLGPPFGGKHFVQFITLDPQSRPRAEIAQSWTAHLVAAIRKVDPRHLVTVGLVDWSLDRKGITSGFVPQSIASEVDFVSVHLYPEAGKLDDAVETLKGFDVGKPVVIEELFPLRCSASDLEEFIAASRPYAAGWISFYWGTSPEELRRSTDMADTILSNWLTKFTLLGAKPPSKE
jgi:hypothetical protein